MTLARSAFHGFQIGFKRCKSAHKCKSCRSRRSREYLLRVFTIYLQKSASIQPRTSLTKFGGKLNSIFIRLLNGYALYSVDFLVCRAFVFEICAALFEALQREGSRIFFFVHDILRHGSRKSAEEAIFKADNWNTLRQFELLFTVLRVGATRSRNARVERAFVDPAQQLPLRSSAKNPRGILILVPVFQVRSSARRFW